MVVIGFAAETQNLLANAEKKLASKHADMIVANDVTAPQAGFDKDSNQVTLIQEGQEPVSIGPKSKQAVAQDIVAHLVTILDR